MLRQFQHAGIRAFWTGTLTARPQFLSETIIAQNFFV